MACYCFTHILENDWKNSNILIFGFGGDVQQSFGSTQRIDDMVITDAEADPKISGDPQNAWCLVETPVQTDDLGLPSVQETAIR